MDKKFKQLIKEFHKLNSEIEFSFGSGKKYLTFRDVNYEITDFKTTDQFENKFYDRHSKPQLIFNSKISLDSKNLRSIMNFYTEDEKKFYIRHYRIFEEEDLQTKNVKVRLRLIGPSVDLVKLLD